MRERFYKYRLLVTLLLVSEVLLGLGIIVITAVYQYMSSSFLIPSQMDVFAVGVHNCYISGFQLFAIYTASIYMWKCVWGRRYSTSIRWLLSIWLFFCWIVIICGCATLWSTMRGADSLSEYVSAMLFRGINEYYTNPEWKLLWDQLQYSHKCCGVNVYSDWMNASWVPVAAKEPNNLTSCLNRVYEQEIVESLRKLRRKPVHIGSPKHFSVSQDPTLLEEIQLQDNKRSIGMESDHALAPYACCRHESFKCYRSYSPRSSTDEPIPHLNLADIFTRGCLPLHRKYTQCFTTSVLILILAAVFINICLCCLTKYLMINHSVFISACKNSFPYFDDDGQALVVVQCPPRVRCIVLEEPDNACDWNLHNISSNHKACACSCDNAEYSKAGTHVVHDQNDIFIH